MDFKDQIKQLGDRVTKLKDQIQTEEATKNAFIMPFLQVLGYDVFNPMEVVPEYITDIGTKKGEKIDYAIFKDGNPTILIECKHWAQNLNVHDGQILRYFHASKAKFGLLTNGVTYRDAQSYFAILLDDNNRKTICRLYLNGYKKYFVTLDDQKKEVKNEITSLDDIFKYAETLFSIVDNYDKSKKTA